MVYRAFISYNRNDRRWAEWLHRKLETYRVPKGIKLPEGTARRLFPVFRDRDELTPAPDLQEALITALDQSEWLIVVCSPSSAESRWVGEEIRHFIETGRKDKILLFIVDQSTNGTTNTSKSWLHPNLAFDREGIAMQEPLAADATDDGEGRNAAFLKTVAAILGIGFGHLMQRDRKRKKRRTIITTILLLIVIGLGTGTGLELRKRSQQTAANQARLNETKKASEGLHQMVATLAQGDRDDGRLIECEKALGGIEEYLTQLPESEKSLEQRQMVGKIAGDRGQLLHLLGMNLPAVDAERQSLAILDQYGAGPGESVELARCKRLSILANSLAYIQNPLEAKKIALQLLNEAIPALRRSAGDANPQWCRYMLMGADVTSKVALGGGNNRESLDIANRYCSEASTWWDRYQSQNGSVKYLIADEMLAMSVRKMMLAIFLLDEQAFKEATAQAFLWNETGVNQNPTSGHYLFYKAQIFGHRGDWALLHKDYASAKSDYEINTKMLESYYLTNRHSHMVQISVLYALSYYRLAAAQAKTGKGIDDPKVIEYVKKGHDILKEQANNGLLETSYIELLLKAMENITNQGIQSGAISMKELLAIRLAQAELRSFVKPSAKSDK